MFRRAEELKLEPRKADLEGFLGVLGYLGACSSRFDRSAQRLQRARISQWSAKWSVEDARDANHHLIGLPGREVDVACSRTSDRTVLNGRAQCFSLPCLVLYCVTRDAKVQYCLVVRRAPIESGWLIVMGKYSIVWSGLQL